MPDLSNNTTMQGDIRSSQSDFTYYSSFFLFIAVFTLLAPMMSLGFIISLCMFRFAIGGKRINPKDILAYSLIIAVLFVPFGWLLSGWESFLAPVIAWKGIIEGAPVSVFSFIYPSILVEMPVGMILGALYTFKMMGRVSIENRKEVYNFHRSIFTVIKAKKHTAEILENRNFPLNGSAIGIEEETGDKVIIKGGHGAFIGATGTGKTTTILGYSRGVINNKSPLVLIDLKGDRDIAFKLKKFADASGVPFHNVTFPDPNVKWEGPGEHPAFFDVFKYGDTHSRTEIINSSREWGSEPVYKSNSERFTSAALGMMAVGGYQGNWLRGLSSLTDIHTMKREAIPFIEKYIRSRGFTDEIPTETEIANMNISPVEKFNMARIVKVMRLIKDWENSNSRKSSDSTLASAISTTKTAIDNILDTPLGDYLQVPPPELAQYEADLYKVAKEGGVVVFTFNGSKYREASALMANMVLQSIKVVAGILEDEKFRTNNMKVIIDEFSVLSTTEIQTLLQRVRSVGMSIILSTQSPEDIVRAGGAEGEQLYAQIQANLSWTFYQKPSEADAKRFIEAIGMTKERKFSEESRSRRGIFGLSTGAKTGRVRSEEVEVPIVSNEDFRDLEPFGWGYLLNRKGKMGKTRNREDDKYITKVHVIAGEDTMTVSGMESMSPSIFNEPDSHAELVSPILDKGIEEDFEDVDLAEVEEIISRNKARNAPTPVQRRPSSLLDSLNRSQKDEALPISEEW